MSTDRSPASSGEVTQLLRAACDGDSEAYDRVFPLIYDSLRDLARAHLRGERRDHTLQPTALVHEAYLKLADQHAADISDRNHFLSVASQAIRRVLVDHARARNREKRGGGAIRITLSDAMADGSPRDVDLLDLDQALQALEQEDELDHRIVVLRFFGGLTVAEIAAALQIGERTVRRRWSFSRAWLYRRLNDPGSN